MMKKTMALILTVGLLISLLGQVVMAGDSEAESRIITLVKSRVGQTDHYENFELHQNDEDVYSLFWSTEQKDNYGSMEVMVNTDGVILNFHQYQSGKNEGKQKPRLSKIDRKAAYDRAVLLVAELNPDIAHELYLKDAGTGDLYNHQISFEIQRRVNGFDVISDTGHVALDEKAERITDFYINYTPNGSFDIAAPVLVDRQKVKEAFAEKIGLKLAYFRKYDKGGSTIHPLYYIENISDKISAADGTAVSVSAYRYKQAMDLANSGAMKNMMVEDSIGTLSQAEQTELEKHEKLLSKEEGIAKIKASTVLPFDEMLTLSNYSLYRNSNDKDVFHARYSFNLSQDDMYKNASYVIDAQTGDIISFYKNSYMPDVKEYDDGKYLSREAVLEIADNAFTALAGDKKEAYRLNATEMDEKNSHENVGYVSYTRYVNEIPFTEDGVYFSINAKTGEIESYSIQYSNCEFPGIKNILSLEQATDSLMAQYDYTPCYMAFYRKDKETSYKLVYDFKSTSSVRLDAFSGEKFSFYNEPKQQPFEGYTDVAGHYAEAIINQLAENGIRVKGNRFTPDETISQGDFALLIQSVFSRVGPVILKSSESADYTAFLRNGYVEEESFDSEKPLTRIEAAKILIRAMGAEPYAQLEGIYSSPFSDVSEDIGYVCLLFGMGIIKGDTAGMFNPASQITYADAAILIYNYLTI